MVLAETLFYLDATLRVQGDRSVFIPNVELHECDSLEEASALLTRHAPDARLLAGGTDLLVDLKTARVDVTHLVSVDRLDALRGVTVTDGALRIGAMTRISQLSASPSVSGAWSPILDATREMASPQIRNMATVGGNIASAVPCADLPPILIVFGASVVLWSPAGDRTVALDALFTGPRRIARRNDELLTAVVVPEPAEGFGAAYERFALRNANGIAVASVAAGLCVDNDGRIAAARVVIGAVAPIPKLVESAAAALIGQAAGAGTFDAAADAVMRAAEPISDVRGSAEFRRQLVPVLTRRALEKACRRAGGNKS